MDYTPTNRRGQGIPDHERRERGMKRRGQVGGRVLGACVGALVVLIASSVHAKMLVLEAEVMEGSMDIVLPGPEPGRVRYAILHHKYQKDQPILSAWLRRHGGAHISFQTQDGTVHRAVLQRLKHCFGRGLLLYTDPVPLEAKTVILLRLETTD
jgi:hypothetical protein